jgi:trimeric autotransporter adhesin
VLQQSLISAPAAAGFLFVNHQENMPQFHRAIILVGLLAVFTGLASAQGNPFICTTNVTVTPALRGESYTESTGDITISCTGGTAPAPGTAIPSVTITLYYNTSVTSRLLPTVGDPSTNNVSEALLLIDEPGSGLPTYGASLPQMLCTTSLVGCAAMVGAVPGPTLNTAVSSGSSPAPNVYQGVVSGNSVTFIGIPVLVPGAAGVRVFRITNVRVNAQYLAGSPSASPVQASMSISGGISVPIQNPSPVVGFVSNGLTGSAGSAVTLSQCSSQTKTSVNTLTFTENFGTAFKARVFAQSNTIYAGQSGNPIQNVPGVIYPNSESGFVLPTANPGQVAGLADFGTRLKATFNNVPAGARIFVSTANVNNNGLPVTAPNPIGGASGNANVQAYIGYAQLVNGEGISDGNSGPAGFVPAVPPTDYGPLNGNVPISEIPIINGTGTAVWEVINTNPNSIESFKFAVYVTYAANVAQNSPPPGFATVNLSFGATANSGVAADAGSPLPRFVADAYAPRALFGIQACSAPSLTIAKAHTGNFAPGQSNAVYSVVVSNQAGAGPTSGTVTVTETVPLGMTLVSMAGTGWMCLPGGTTCTRSDELSGGSSYPPIAVTVNVASNAASQLTNQVSVSGGGSSTANTSDPTAVASAGLSIAKTHNGNFAQGQSGATYLVTVTNQAGAGPTNGTVTVTEAVPSGLTLVSMGGTGWTCPTGGTICTRSDPLGGGASYPPITVTVNVSLAAPLTVTNQVSVSGGGSATAGANDITTVTPPTYLISTLAGGMLPPTANPATQVDIGRPFGVTVEAAGNVYFSNQYTSVFKLDASGVLTRVAGTGVAGFSGDNGPAVSAQLNQPKGLAVDGSGNLYIADSMNDRIRKVAPNGMITTVAGSGVRWYFGDDGPATNAALYLPYGVAADGLGNLYIADTFNQRVRRVSVNGTITTVAGTGTASFYGDGGPAANAALYYPEGLAFDPSGNLYIADSGNYRVRRVAANGIITTVAGNGILGPSTDGQPAVSTPIDPIAIDLDSSGNLYLNDNGVRIRRVSGANGIVTTIAGSYNWGFGGDGGSALGAAFNSPYGIAVDASGSIYVADSFNHRIRKVTASGTISTVAGGGTGDANAAPFGGLNLPQGIARDAGGNLYIADQNGHRVRKISPNGTITTVAGTGVSGYSGDLGAATNAQLSFPNAVAADSSGNVYISENGNARIRKVAANGTINTIAGNGNCAYSGDGGQAVSASICAPAGVAVDSAGNLYFADSSNDRVRKVSTNGVITTVAGTGELGYSGDNGPATSAALYAPVGLAIDPAGNLYIGDSLFRIRKVATTGIITTVAGNGTNGFSGDGGSATSAAIGPPRGLAVDASGTIYFVDGGNSRVRAVTSDGIIRTVAGNGVWDYAGDGGLATSAEINFPSGLAVDPNGNVYIADTYNDAIRVLTPVGARPVLSVNSTHAGNLTAGQNGTYTVTVSNAASACGTTGTITVSEVPFHTVLSSMSGTGWSCSGNTCTRSDTLTGGASYPPVSVTVSAPLTSPAQITNQVSVSGGGGVMAGASDLTTVIIPPSLAIAKTHTGNFVQGQTGLYTVIVSNGTLAGPTSGTVTVTESVPTGLTLVSMAGSGWTCPGTAANNCMRSDVLAAGGSYPPITVTVNVAQNATSPQLNAVSVSGGGAATANATDSTIIVVTSQPATITSPANGSTLSSSSVTFQWTTGISAARYQLSISRSQGGADLYNQDQGSNLSATVPGLPVNGGILWVRLWTLISGAWQYGDYSYTACSGSCGGSSPAAVITSPSPSTTLTSSSVTFQWTTGTGAARYQLSISRAQGGADLYNQDQASNLSATVTGLPTSGGTLWVRLWTLISGAWQYNDYTYTA